MVALIVISSAIIGALAGRTLLTETGSILSTSEFAGALVFYNLVVKWGDLHLLNILLIAFGLFWIWAEYASMKEQYKDHPVGKKIARAYVLSAFLGAFVLLVVASFLITCSGGRSKRE